MSLFSSLKSKLEKNKGIPIEENDNEESDTIDKISAEETESEAESDDLSENPIDLQEETVERVTPETSKQKKLFAAVEKWLWYPETKHKTEIVKCKACYEKFFKTSAEAISHLGSKSHKQKAKEYVIKENIEKAKEDGKFREKIEKRKAKNLKKKQRWLERKKLQKKNALTLDVIEKKKMQFQQKKARRLERKSSEKEKT